MKQSHTGLLVVTLLALIIINNTYNQTNTLEGFEVDGMIQTDGDFKYPNEYIFTINENTIVKKGNEKDIDFLKNKIIDAIKQFNIKLKEYIDKYIKNDEYANMNIKYTLNNKIITFIKSILFDLFSYIIYIIRSFKKLKTDDSITQDILNKIETYFQKANTYIVTVLNKELLNKYNDNKVKLYTTDQTTDNYNGEPSIIHFSIICDLESDIYKFLSDTNISNISNVKIQINLCNSINYTIYKCYKLDITLDFNKENNTNPTYSLNKVLNEVAIPKEQPPTQGQSNTSDDLGIGAISDTIQYISKKNPIPTDPIVGKVIACVIIGTTAIVIALYYYFLKSQIAKTPNAEDSSNMANDMMKYINLPNILSNMKNMSFSTNEISNIKGIGVSLFISTFISILTTLILYYSVSLSFSISIVIFFILFTFYLSAFIILFNYIKVSSYMPKIPASVSNIDWESIQKMLSSYTTRIIVVILTFLYLLMYIMYGGYDRQVKKR